MVGMFLYVFSYVIMLENYIFELVLNMIGIVDQCIKNYIVYENKKWIELLNDDCVCYNNKRIG